MTVNREDWPTSEGLQLLGAEENEMFSDEEGLRSNVFVGFTALSGRRSYEKEGTTSITEKVIKMFNKGGDRHCDPQEFTYPRNALSNRGGGCRGKRKRFNRCQDVLWTKRMTLTP